MISARPVYLERAAKWIRKLDQQGSTNDEQLFVYEIQNRPAKELAAVLQSVLSKGGVEPNEAEPTAEPQQSPVAPDLITARIDSGNGVATPATAVSYEPSPSSGSAAGKSPSVVADIENNALLVSTTAKEYKRIERILHQLDVLPTQVMIEAVIAEVRLNDELKFGLRLSANILR